MKYIGKIDKIDKLVVSDPSYDKTVLCRYENENINMKSCNIEIEIENITKYYSPKMLESMFHSYKGDGIEITTLDFAVLIKNPHASAKLYNTDSYYYSNTYNESETTIAMDTSSISVGINEKANEINERRSEWHPSNSLRTTVDGVFGNVIEISKNNEIKGIFLFGSISEEAGYEIDDIIDYLKEQLQIKDLRKVNIEQEDITNEKDREL